MATNVGLDLEASAMPLTPDPAVRGRRKPAVDFNARVQAIARQLVAGGMDPTEANQVAVSRALQEGQASITPEDVAAERQAALSSGVELGINDPAVLGMEEETGPYQGAGRPGYDRTFTPDEIAAQRAEMADGGAPVAFTVPGPRMPYGGGVRPGAPIYDERQAAAYTQRVLDPRTMQASPSQRDLAMSVRGMTPVYNPDGSVGYSVEAYPEDDPATPQNEGAPFPGGVGRLGRRQDLLDAGWEAREVAGPTGMQTVYRPGETAAQRYTQQADARTRSRLKRSAGISSADAAGLSLDQLRAQARNAKDDDYIARNERWKAQAMLAGGQPTGGPRGTKAATAALQMLPPEWQSLVLAKGLRPDIDGTTPLTVDANSAKNAMRMMNAEIFAEGAGGLGGVREQMRRDQRKDNAKGYFDSWYSNREPGLDGDYTWAQHDSQVNYLMNQFGLTRAEAEAIAQSRGLPRGSRGGEAAPSAAPPAGYPGASPSPPPSNPLAAPRPYG